MPRISGEALKKAFEVEPKAVSKGLGELLRDFGYPSATDKWVEGEIRRLLEGGEPGGEPSIFLAEWLEEGID